MAKTKNTYTPQANEYEFDSALFRTFLADLGIQRRPLLEKLNIPPTTWDRWRSRGVLPVTSLVQVCNTLCIPISRFIKSTSSVPGKVTYDMMWEEDIFAPIEYKHNLLGDYLTYGRGQSVDEACAQLRTCPHYFYLHFRNQVVSRIPITDYLMRCNYLKMWPGNWLIDNNEPITLIDGYSVTKFSEADASKLANAVAMVNHLTLTLKDKNKQIEELQNELERMRELNKTQNYITKAAEDE